MTSPIPLLLGAIWILSLAWESTAVCCKTVQYLTFWTDRATCLEVNGTSQYPTENVCLVRICGDGRAHYDPYCGKGPCNLLGCQCVGGCKIGHWVRSFKSLNSDYTINFIQILTSYG
ncbi:hypothetical protein KR009_010954 [Drosophila setifemur]|nr:hypothetical protein KR009_010954 [Drosophila setifemur]